MKLRILTLLALVALTLTACLSLAEDVTPPPGYVAPSPAPTLAAVFPASAPNINAGAAIFAEKCAPCHGATGQSDGPQTANLPVKVPALGTSAIASAAAPVRWFTIVTEGNIQNMMPPFASLTDQQRWEVVAYALSLSAPAEQVQAGKALYEVNCAECHGADGRQLPEADLANQETLAKLSNNDVVAVIQQGLQPGMPAIALADQDAANLAAYVRTFTFAPSEQVSAVQPTLEPASGTPETPTTAGAAPTVAAAPEQPTGKISGKVTNGSGGSLPSGLKVTLHTFETDVTTQHFIEGESRETALSATGDYQFDKIALTETAAYFVSIEVDGIIYESDPAIPAQDGLTEYILPITIYETTTDASALSIANAHILYDYSLPGKIQVVEFFVVKNAGTKTVISAQPGGAVVEIPLPAGYQNLQFEDGLLGERFIQTSSGFGDTQPIAPTNETNQVSLVFAFDLPYEASTSPLAGIFGGNEFELSQKFNLQVESISLLVPVGVKAAGGQNFSDGGTQSMGGGFTFQLYKAGALAAGQTFTAKVSGTPQGTSSETTSTSAGSNQNIIIGIGAFGVALMLAGGFLYLRDRQARDAVSDESDEDDDEDDELSEDDLLDAIIALDDQYKAGNLSEPAYKERRAELKAKLMRNA